MLISLNKFYLFQIANAIAYGEMAKLHAKLLHNGADAAVSIRAKLHDYQNTSMDPTIGKKKKSFLDRAHDVSFGPLVKKGTM